MTIALAAASLSMTSTVPAQIDSCGFTPAFTRADEKGSRTVQVYEGRPDSRLGGTRPLLFISNLKVNTDGTRRSYKVDDPRAKNGAINDMRNAMQAGRSVADFDAVARAGWQPASRTWSILLPDVIEKDARTGKPCIDASGYLVSMTSDVAVTGGWGRVGDCRQDKWIDALSVNALVLPKPPRGGTTEFDARGATNRTPVVAMTLNGTRRVALGLVGDKGPRNELGEASVAMNRSLNGLALADLPKNYRDAVVRFQGPRSAILLFPGTAHRIARPLTAHNVEAATGDLFKRWGGEQRLVMCLGEIPHS